MGVVAFKGKVYDVCAELQAEAARCKGIKVGEYLRRKKARKNVETELHGNGTAKRFQYHDGD